MTQQKLNSLAMGLLAIREHSRFELKQKLARHSSESNSIDAVLDELEKNNYLSEKRFVEAYIHSKKNRGYGPNVIQQSLVLKRVNKTLIAQMLAQVSDWDEHAKKAYQKKYADTMPDDYAETAKRKRYLQQRGFLNEHILSVLPMQK